MHKAEAKRKRRGRVESPVNPKSQAPEFSRRTMIKTAAAAALGVVIPHISSSRAATGEPLRTGTLKYLKSLAMPPGAYVWQPGGRPHLTPTFAVVGCYHALRQVPENRAALAEFICTHHPSRLKKLEQEHREFEFQQIQALAWLGQDVSAFREQVSKWTKPTVYLKQYERHGWPILRQEVTAFTCRALLGLPMADLNDTVVPYFDSRRRFNGSFNNTPASDGSDGHVINTWWGLQALKTLRREAEAKTETIAWLRACQLPNGGFTWQPKPKFAGVDDVAYTWAALRALQLLGSAPPKRQPCIDYLLSLANSDGGFGDRRGWLSNPLATYYTLDALHTLGALDSVRVARKAAPSRKTSLPPSLHVYSIQIEAHGQGSPSEAVDLADSLKIHLWGAKNASAKWIAAAQAFAKSRKVPVQFFTANEEYGTWVNVPGLGTYSHTSDIVAPAGANFGPSLGNRDPVSWTQFRTDRLEPLLKARGRLIWQFGENEELVRLFLDDSLDRGGYAAVSTFHFGNPDFTNSEPFLQRYRGRIPFIALQDAHGEEPWWLADMTTGFRTLFLGTEPTWEAWLKALEANWVAAIRHDSVSGNETWSHAGNPDVLKLVERNSSSWRWWDNLQVQRPIVSLVAVRPEDEFEVARPEQGVTLRIRCAWENTAQGQPKTPIAELTKLTVDGQEVSPTLVTVPSPTRGRGALADHYHRFDMRQPTAGKHAATAFVRVLKTNAISKRTLEFTV